MRKTTSRKKQTGFSFGSPRKTSIRKKLRSKLPKKKKSSLLRAFSVMMAYLKQGK